MKKTQACNKIRVGVSKGNTRESERHTEEVREQQDSRNGTMMDQHF